MYMYMFTPVYLPPVAITVSSYVYAPFQIQFVSRVTFGTFMSYSRRISTSDLAYKLYSNSRYEFKHVIRYIVKYCYNLSCFNLRPRKLRVATYVFLKTHLEVVRKLPSLVVAKVHVYKSWVF